jgi:CheY-like chemotaxis protein
MTAKTVLVADDHDILRDAYSLLLEKSGYRVLRAANGGEAVRIAAESWPDVILMDLAMPVLSGLEAALALKASPATAGIPIIGLTAHFVSPERERMRQLCDAFLTKPCHPSDLVREVGRVAAARAPTVSH